MSGGSAVGWLPRSLVTCPFWMPALSRGSIRKRLVTSLVASLRFCCHRRIYHRKDAPRKGDEATRGPLKIHVDAIGTTGRKFLSVILPLASNTIWHCGIHQMRAFKRFQNIRFVRTKFQRELKNSRICKSYRTRTFLFRKVGIS